MHKDSWISVRDELPEIADDDLSQVVLIATPSRSRPRRLVTSVGYVMLDRANDLVTWHDCMPWDTVTHPRYWQPLPDPPGEDECPEMDRNPREAESVSETIRRNDEFWHALKAVAEITHSPELRDGLIDWLYDNRPASEREALEEEVE